MREKICITILRRQLEELKEAAAHLHSEELQSRIQELEEAINKVSEELCENAE